MNVFTPEQYGAVGDGAADDTAAVQAAYDAAYAVTGVLQLDARVYRITAPIDTKDGHVTVRGLGYETRSVEKYGDSGNGYLTQTTGSRIYADGCSAFTRNDGPRGYLRFEHFCVIGSAIDVPAFDFGSPTTYQTATQYNEYIDIGVFKIGTGFDASLHYGSVWRDCRANGCKVGFRLGWPDAGDSSGNANRVENFNADACDSCFLLLEGTGLQIDRVLAEQDCKDFLVLRPKGNNTLAQVEVRGAHVETNRSGNSLVTLDGSLGTDVGPVTVGCSDVALEDVVYQGSGNTALGTASVGTHTYLIRLRMVRVNNQSGPTVTVPDYVRASTWIDCKFTQLDVSAPKDVVVQQVQTNTSGGQGGVTRLRKEGADLLPLDVRMFGALPDVAGGGDKIQAAIDEFIANPTKYSYVWIPTGVWKTTKGLLIGRQDGQYVRCIIRGGDVSQTVSVDNPVGGGGALIIFDDTSAASRENFVLGIQAALGVSITGVGLAGANHAPTDLGSAFGDSRNLFLGELANWIGSGIRTNRWSPHALLVIDPFERVTTTVVAPSVGQSLPQTTIHVAATTNFDPSGTLLITTDAGVQSVTYTGKTGTTFTDCSGGTGTMGSGALVAGPLAPDGDPLNRYPDWDAAYYARAALKSVNVLLTSCWGRGGYIGTACSPAGFGNGESIVFEHCGFGYCTIAHAFGQSQSRGCVLDDPRGWVWCYVAVDTFSIGQGNGTPPQIVNGAVGACKYLFNIGANTQKFLVTGLYAEALHSIGRVGYGSQANGGKFVACSFVLMSTAAASNPSAGGVVLPDAPFHILTAGSVELDGCAIGSSEDFVLRLDNRGTLVLRDTNIFYKYRNGKVMVGFNDVDAAVVERVTLLPDVEIVQENPEFSRWSVSQLFTPGGMGLGVLHQTGPASGTIALTDTSNVAIGDLVGALPGGGGTQWSPTFIAPAPGGTVVPWGVVTSVTLNTSITLSFVGKGVPFDDATGTAMQRFRWDGTATDGGVLSRGALYTRGATGPVVGDAVYVSASDTIDKADASDSAKMPAIGIMVARAANNTKARVVTFGEVQGVFSGLTVGATYYVDDKSKTAGAITTTAPMDTGRVVQVIGCAKNTTTLVAQFDRDFTVR